MGARNRVGIGLSYHSASLFSLAGRYDNPIPTRFLARIDCLTIPALDRTVLGKRNLRIYSSSMCSMELCVLSCPVSRGLLTLDGTDGWTTRLAQSCLFHRPLLFPSWWMECKKGMVNGYPLSGSLWGRDSNHKNNNQL
jgi:hypothetical protein